MAWSKFDPHLPPAADEAGGASARRRARVLKWANWIVLLYTALGFGLIVYWLVKGS